MVRKMNSWPRSEASRATVKIEYNLSAKDIISIDLPTSQEGDLFTLQFFSWIRNERNFCQLIQTFKDTDGILCVCVCVFFSFPGTALKTRYFIASLLVLAKMLNFQNACFVYKWRTKSEGVHRLIPVLQFCITLCILANESAKKVNGCGL